MLQPCSGVYVTLLQHISWMKEPLFLSRGEGIYRLWLIDYVPDRVITPNSSDERLYPRQLRFILAEINQLNTRQQVPFLKPLGDLPN